MFKMDTSKKTILVVDDDKSILRTFTRILQKSGYEIEVAETGKEAMEKAEGRHYDLALVDIRLPDMDGTELLAKLKKQLQKSSNGAQTRERTFAANGENKKGGMLKRVVFLLLVIAAIAAIRFSDATQYLEQEKLSQLIQGYGALAPLIYMLVYTVAPSLFLPGLPLTIAGGILFGPFWGVVYTITSATLGACLAFLISRYIARDWVEKKLKSPRWKQLDQGVEKHGWKIVAFTRLIPLFPFNLLNYAFGLTRINFLSYAATTFICMLPACIAFIVFSSSLLDLIKGRVSPAFLVGLGLVVLVSLIPLFYQRYKAKKGLTDPL